jgi:3-methylcrotonyl-CoA carboxylase alpha subunit
MFRKLLIANRGEIACRIIRTARRLGMATVAVYSEADRDARHVALADEAFFVGAAPARESYLAIDKIVDAAEKSRAEAIHPGYGFLSENADFAEACSAAGLVFVGPPPEAMRLMGPKASAKALMERAGVPIVPGYHGDATDFATLEKEARRIGFPLLVKASNGGGGRGMRVVPRESDLAEAVAAASREALSAFGEGRVLLERRLARPRHVEVQIFADAAANCIAFPERDCSLQRRRQKILEETPAARLAEGLRSGMREAAVVAAQSAGYLGAGTVEFLVEDERFYFLEMNARLQVEHPITEMVAGQDLVEWQLRVAAGEALPLRQADLVPKGAAMEARICAESPERDFLPSVGKIERLRFPDCDGHIRVDSGVREGDVVTPHYDSLLAKLIVWGEDRASALRRLLRALESVEIVGVATNLDFLRALCAESWFESADYDTTTVESNAAQPTTAPTLSPSDENFVLAAGATAWLLAARRKAHAGASRRGDPNSPWTASDVWRLGGPKTSEIEFLLEGRSVGLGLRPESEETFRIERDGKATRIAFREYAEGLRLDVDGVQRDVGLSQSGADVTVVLRGRNYSLAIHDPLDVEAQAADADRRLVAPLPARVVRVNAAEGQSVKAGDAVVTLEVMKTEFVLRAPQDGIVAGLACREGDSVAEGVLLARIDAPEEGHAATPDVSQGAS